MRQRYDNVAKFVTTEYAEPFVELILMQESPFFREYIQEAEERAMERGLERGLERGQKKCAIDLILELLSEQFQSEVIQTLKPDLERIDDLDRLKQLLRAVPKTPSLEAFTKSVREI